MKWIAIILLLPGFVLGQVNLSSNHIPRPDTWNTNSNARWGYDTAKHYFDQVNGNDSWEAHTPAIPKKTISELNGLTLDPGDSALFNKGDEWRESLVVPSSGEEGSPITISSYGQGNKPLINGSTILSNWDSEDYTTFSATSYTTILRDDEAVVDGTNYNVWSYYTIIGLSGGETFENGFRFRNIAVDLEATIASAYITFVPKWDIDEGASVKFVGENTVTPAVFSSNADFQARKVNATTAFVDWTIPYQATPFNTPDIKDIISEITSLPSWTSGNDLVIFMLDDGVGTDGADVLDADIRPVLHITVSAPSVDVWSKAEATPVNQLFVDDVRVPLSRWPLTGWMNIDATAGDLVTLNSDLLNQSDDFWIGSTAIIKTVEWEIQNRIITDSDSSDNIIIWADDLGYATPTTEGYAFYIEDHPEMISSPLQWAYSDGKVYLQVEPGNTPADYVIEASVEDFGVYVPEHDFITIDGLGIQKTNLYAVKIDDSNNSIVKNCSITQTRGGINVFGTAGAYDNIQITDNVITNSYESYGMSVTGVNNSIISNNTISNIASDTLSPKWAVGIAVSGNPILVSDNTLLRIAGHGIFPFSSTSGIVRGNSITQAVMNVSDNGGIYTFGTHDPLTIIQNGIYNTRADNTGNPFAFPSAGIYLDVNSTNVDIVTNIVNIVDGQGMIISTSSDNTIYNNTVYGASGSSILLLEPGVTDGSTNNLIKNNNLVSIDEETFEYQGTRVDASTGFMETLDYNLYFSVTDTVAIRYKKDGSSNDYSFTTWKVFSSMDANSMEDDPLFVSSSDLSLQEGSPAINAGVDIGLAEDYYGNPIVGLPDIGAIESDY